MIDLFDSTLREGAQTPGVAFSLADKLEILALLHQLGVPIAEAGFPATSGAETDDLAAMARMPGRPVLSVLCRCSEAEVDAACRVGAEIIDVDVALNDRQLAILRRSEDEMYAAAGGSIRRARGAGKRVKVSIVDASRTPIERVVRFAAYAAERGAEWITYCDSVGVCTPEEVRDAVAAVASSAGVKVSVHCHNDLGMAVANTVTAAIAGARQLEVTVNGLGDRCGIADLGAVAVALQHLRGVDLGLELGSLKMLSDVVAAASGITVWPLHPIVGGNAFAHSAGIHVAAVLKSPSAFEPFPPEEVGCARRIVLGQHSGFHAVEAVLAAQGIDEHDEGVLRGMAEAVRELGRRRGVVTTEDLFALYSAARG